MSPDYGEEFRGRRVVVTGAAGVVGRWIAEAFAAQGADLLVSDARAEPLQALADELGARAVVADLADAEGVRTLTAGLDEAWPTADVLVNNAGVYPRTPLAETDRATVERILDVNVVAVWELARHVAGTLRAAGLPGAVVNLGSGATRRPTATGAVYAASKAAVELLTRSLAIELAPDGIRVNTVGPGFAPGSEVSSLPGSHVDAMTSSIPLGRTSGPHDAPAAVLWLASSAASFVTGASIDVDGGRTAGEFTRRTS